MRIHADFSVPVIVTPEAQAWVDSPLAGVQRIMLDRIGAEKARATSIVRYAPNSFFTSHEHPGGEEILVLSGVFSDEGGDYPAAWYLRNPPGSSHQPFSREGATIFVKLWQMSPRDTATVRINTRDAALWQRHQDHDVCTLYEGSVAGSVAGAVAETGQGVAECVSLQRWASGRVLQFSRIGGAELLVLEGELVAQGHRCPERTWIRLPDSDQSQWRAGPQGALVYLKSGHLGRDGPLRDDM